MSLILRINIIPLFHKKIISHDLLQKIYPNLARTCKNKFYENKIKFSWLNPLKNFHYSVTDRGTKKHPFPPTHLCQIVSVNFFCLQTHFLTLGPFLGAMPQRWKNPKTIGYSDAEFYAESFEKKNYQKSSPNPKYF